MKPIEFKEQTVKVAENQEEYQTLPAYVEPFVAGKNLGQVVSCWKMSFRERLQLLIFGKVWLSQCAYGQPVQPVYMWSGNPFTKIIDREHGFKPGGIRIRTKPKTGRNDPCPCNSGKKFKKCCLDGTGVNL